MSPRRSGGENRDTDLREFRAGLQLPTEAVGAAVFHGGRFQGLDLFDRHSTLQYFWESLVDGYAIDLLEAPVDPAQPESDEGQVIRSVLDRAIAGTWEKFTPPGEGTEWRMENNDLASAALVWNDEVVVHLQVFPKLGGRRLSIIRRVWRVRVHDIVGMVPQAPGASRGPVSCANGRRSSSCAVVRFSPPGVTAINRNVPLSESICG